MPKAKRAARGGGGKHSYTPPEWRFTELIFGLGDPTSISREIVRRGYPEVPRSSITGWRVRNSIPPFWLPLFIQMGIDAGFISSIEDLRVKP